MYDQWIWTFRSTEVKIGLEMFARVNAAHEEVRPPRWGLNAEEIRENNHIPAQAANRGLTI